MLRYERPISVTVQRRSYDWRRARNRLPICWLRRPDRGAGCLSFGSARRGGRLDGSKWGGKDDDVARHCRRTRKDLWGGVPFRSACARATARARPSWSWLPGGGTIDSATADGRGEHLALPRKSRRRTRRGARTRATSATQSWLAVWGRATDAGSRDGV